ncbi:hypothetical protein WKR98_13515 [Pigmentiphaga sp. YJ18]|uniref:hypothetical protein n=1 Tax=Pigmentiphaga sp. YJ18 TaxID=3134907 RepID=UPI0031183E75
MADKRLEREQRMYDALKLIAKGYETPTQLRKSAEKYGLDFEEALEYAYENIRATAADAIRGMKRPSASTLATEKGE